MADVVIKAERRTIKGKKVKNLRNEGILPGIIYGRHIEPISISLDMHITRFLRSLNPSVLVQVDLGKEKLTTLVRDKQFDVIRGNLIHVDLQAVSLTEKINSSVSIEFIGIAPAIEDFNATLVTETEQIDVEALPQDLPEKVIVDISVLKKIGDSILVSSIKLADSVTILTDPESMIILATTTREIEEEEEIEDEFADELGEPEVIERGKSEEEDED